MQGTFVTHFQQSNSEQSFAIIAQKDYYLNK